MRLEQAGDRLEVALDVVERALGDLQRDERLDAEAGGGDVDVRAVAGDDAGVLQPLEPGGHGGPGDAGDARELEDAGARVLAQRRRAGRRPASSSGGWRPLPSTYAVVATARICAITVRPIDAAHRPARRGCLRSTSTVCGVVRHVPGVHEPRADPQRRGAPRRPRPRPAQAARRPGRVRRLDRPVPGVRLGRAGLGRRQRRADRALLPVGVRHGAGRLLRPRDRQPRPPRLRADARARRASSSTGAYDPASPLADHHRAHGDGIVDIALAGARRRPVHRARRARRARPCSSSRTT